MQPAWCLKEPRAAAQPLTGFNIFFNQDKSHVPIPIWVHVQCNVPAPPMMWPPRKPKRLLQVLVVRILLLPYTSTGTCSTSSWNATKSLLLVLVLLTLFVPLAPTRHHRGRPRQSHPEGWPEKAHHKHSVYKTYIQIYKSTTNASSTAPGSCKADGITCATTHTLPLKCPTFEPQRNTETVRSSGKVLQ